MKRRHLLGISSAAPSAAWLATAAALPASRRKPNFIVVLCDDLGFGDVGAMGGRTIRTPNIDRMARGGTVLTDYYAPANICTPSRAGLLTGRYPIRTGLAWQVIMAGDKRGFPLSELTIPAELKSAGYASALMGKWHLGHVAPYSATSRSTPGASALGSWRRWMSSVCGSLRPRTVGSRSCWPSGSWISRS
jgi:arylsulfatase A